MDEFCDYEFLSCDESHSSWRGNGSRFKANTHIQCWLVRDGRPTSDSATATSCRPCSSPVTHTVHVWQRYDLRTDWMQYLNTFGRFIISAEQHHVLPQAGLWVHHSHQCSSSSLSLHSLVSLRITEAQLLFIAVLWCVVMSPPVLPVDMGWSPWRSLREVLSNKTVRCFVIHSTWT